MIEEKKENYIIVLDSVLKNIKLNSTDKLVLGIVYSLSIKSVHIILLLVLWIFKIVNSLFNFPFIHNRANI